MNCSFYKKMGIIVFIGVLAYLIFLNPFNAWFDEQFELFLFGKSWSEMLRIIMTEDGHPPFHYILFRLWMGGLDYHTVLWGRVFPIVCLTATALLGIGPVKRLCGEKSAVIFTILVFVLPWSLFLGTDMRMYGLFNLEITLAVVYALLIIKEGKIGDWIKFGLVQIAMLYTHYYAGLILVILNVFLFLSILKQNNCHRNMILLFTTGGVAGICFLPWFLFVFLNQTNNMYENWYPDYNSILGAFATFLIPVFNANTFLFIVYCLFCSLSWLLLIQFVWDERHHPMRRIVAAPIILWFGAFVLALGVSIALRPILSWRYMMPFSGVIALGLSVVMLHEKRFRKLFWILVMMSFGLGCVHRISVIHSSFYKDFQSIIRKQVSRDALILCDSNHTCLILAFYLPEYRWQLALREPEQTVLKDMMFQKRLKSEAELETNKELYYFTQDLKKCQYPMINRNDHNVAYCFVPVTPKEAKKLLHPEKKERIITK